MSKMAKLSFPKKPLIMCLIFLLFILIFLPTINAKILVNERNIKSLTKTTKLLCNSYRLIKNDLSDFTKLEPKWVKFWGGNRIERESKIAIDKESGFIYIAGNTKSFNNFVQPFLLKYDINGKLLWYKILFEQEGNVFGIDVKNGFIYLTGLRFISNSDTDVFIAKYNGKGDRIWFDTWGGNYCDIGFDVACYENYVFVVGRTSSYGKGCSDILLLKYEDKGASCKLVWYKTWGCQEDDEALAIVTDGKDIYICGSTEYASKGASHDGLLLKFDLSTKKFSLLYTWSKDDYDQLRDLVLYEDHIFAVGWTRSLEHGYDIIVLSYNLKSAEIEWNKTWGELDANIAYGVTHSENYIFVTGEVIENKGFSQERAAIVLKFRLDGALEWSKVWGKIFFAGGEDIAFYQGNFYVVGNAFHFFKKYTDVFIIECNKDGGKFLRNSVFLSFYHTIYRLFGQMPNWIVSRSSGEIFYRNF
jgi:hypothetical protein